MLRANVRGVTNRRHAQVDAALPERIVVVRGIDRDRLPAFGKLPELRRVAKHFRIRLANLGADHHGFVAEFEHGEFQFADRFFGRERRDARDRPDALVRVAEHIRIHRVEGPAAGLAQFVVAHVECGKARRREHVGEVDAAFFHARGKVAREHRHRAVARVRGRGIAPPDHLRRAVRRGALQPARLDFGAGDLADVFVEQPFSLDRVAVGIDDGMIEFGANVAAGKFRVA